MTVSALSRISRTDPPASSPGHAGPDGKPLFYRLLRRRAPQHVYAFDLLWIDGRDVRDLPLLNRKEILRSIIPPQPSPALFVEHVSGSGVDLFNAVCASDMEGIVATLAQGRYTPEGTTWVKIKNPQYRQAEGRVEFFDGRADPIGAELPGVVGPGAPLTASS